MGTKLTSRQDLIDYVLRNLGDGVVNIEITEDQLTDRIDDAIQFFIERHYLGVEESVLYHSLSYKDLLNNSTSIPSEFQNITEVYSPNKDSNSLNESGVVAWDSVQYQMEDIFNQSVLGNNNSVGVSSYYISREHFSTMRYLMDTRKRFTHNTITNKFIPIGWNLTETNRYERIKDSTKLDTDNWIKYSDTSVTDDSELMPNGTSTASKIYTDIITNTIGISQEIDLKGYFNSKEFSGVISLKESEYVGDVTLIVTDEYDVELLNQAITLTSQYESTYFKFKMAISNGSKFTIKLESVTTATNINDGFIFNGWSIWKNPEMVLLGYKAIDDSIDTNIFNDIWIKRYSTALIGMQWGENISKFQGVQLPGEITLDGDKIYDRYKTEMVEIMEGFQDEYEMPIDVYLA